MIFIRYYSFAFVVVLFQLSLSLAPDELSFLIISQKYATSSKLANELRQSIWNQVKILAFLENNELDILQQPKIVLSHEMSNSIGSWAITPILATATERHVSTINDNKIASNTFITEKTKWFIVCEDQSIVDVRALINNLKHEDSTKDILLGYPLRDSEATIVHHFSFFENPSWFSYPLFRAGIAISISLLTKLSERVRSERNLSDFFIDASYELSLFAWNNGKGHRLTAAPYFCLEKKSRNDENECAIYSRNSDSSSNQMDYNHSGIDNAHVYSTKKTTKPSLPTATTIKTEPFNTTVSMDEVLFAVKTWSKNHIERIPIIQNTWARKAIHVRYYSDITDSTIPTISTNVENTNEGHCTKTIEIFKMIANEIASNRHLNRLKFVVLCDDDTLLSITTLLDYLRHFNPSADIYLGERYGYQLLTPNGFNYITGGGGIVFSVNVIKELAKSCTCPSLSSPDDMIIALCLQRLGIEPIHSSRFHQARPLDYPKELLLHSKPISFHKFWQIDPFDVYEQWLDGISSMKLQNEYCTKIPNNVQHQVCREHNEN